MALNPATALRSDTRADTPLPGPAFQVLCGLAWLCVACSFSFLDRSRGDFGFFAIAWAVIGATGFGLGLARRQQPERARRPARVLTVLACVLTLFPGYLMFSLARWMAFGVLLLTAARAAAMHTRRDLYYALAAIVAVSLLVLTHDAAQWTVWFYLVPAGLCVALALAWDYAAEVRLPAAAKAAFAIGFLAVCLALGATLSALLPLPAVRGFGFMDPATDNPGRIARPAGGGGSEGGRKGGGQAPEGNGGAGSSSALGDAIDAMRGALRDRGLPGWQHGAVGAMLSMTEALARLVPGDSVLAALRPMSAEERQQMHERAAALRAALDALLKLLLLASAALLLWLARWRIAAAAALGSASVLASWAPGPSMRCAMLGLRCALRRHGHRARPGESLLEHVQSAAMLPAAVRGWLTQAVHTYGAWRFGAARALRPQANFVRRTVSAADEAMRPRKRT